MEILNWLWENRKEEGVVFTSILILITFLSLLGGDKYIPFLFFLAIIGILPLVQLLRKVIHSGRGYSQHETTKLIKSMHNYYKNKHGLPLTTPINVSVFKRKDEIRITFDDPNSIPYWEPFLTKYTNGNPDYKVDFLDKKARDKDVRSSKSFAILTAFLIANLLFFGVGYWLYDNDYGIKMPNPIIKEHLIERTIANESPVTEIVAYSAKINQWFVSTSLDEKIIDCILNDVKLGYVAANWVFDTKKKVAESLNKDSKK